MKCQHYHLAYCTNIHPAETWEETLTALKRYTLKVRDGLIASGKLLQSDPYAIGLRLSAIAAKQLCQGDNLEKFKQWLAQENCYVFTINGFPFGQFHQTRVKENVYKPDWTETERLDYTNQLFDIIADICPANTGGSVSTLPGSFKAFGANDTLIFTHLYSCAQHIAKLAVKTGKDLHLGLEPEPLGHFENTTETLAFFKKFHQWIAENKLDPEIAKKHIGLNYDTCHFALEFDDCADSLKAFTDQGIRISKIHLSNALEIPASDPQALSAIKSFNEPTYLHQFMLKKTSGEIIRFPDLPEFFDSNTPVTEGDIARIHFHIPLYQTPLPPLGSTKSHTEEALALLKKLPNLCTHIEMETYTWGVLPENMQLPLTEQIIEEYHWTLTHA